MYEKEKHDDILLQTLHYSVNVYVCVYYMHDVCVKKIAGDLEISPICCILWSSLISLLSLLSPSLRADLIVGAFGTGEVSVYRYRSKNRNASLSQLSFHLESIRHFSHHILFMTLLLYVCVCMCVQGSSCCVGGSFNESNSQNPEPWWSEVLPTSDR